MDFHDSGDEDGDIDWEEVDEEVENTPPIPCLFKTTNKCDTEFISLEKGIVHLKQSHNIDFLEFKLVHTMDCYSFIKLINFIRKHKQSAEDIIKSVTSATNNKDIFPWMGDEYLKPDNPEDPWLMYDYDDIEELVDVSTPLQGVHHVNVEHGRITMTQEHYISLQDKIKHLTQQLAEAKVELDMRTDDMKQMKQALDDIINKQNDPLDKNHQHDKHYFNSYEDANIHAEMIKDSVRTDSYRNAIMLNNSFFENKHVLDVGAGTGILSTFAVKAGASKVYAIEKSDIAYETMDIVRKNGLSDKIEVFHNLLEDVELPVEKVDIIISEWMGYFLLFEAMVDSVINARNKFLKPGGVVCPNRFTLNLCGASDPALFNDLITFWDNVYGIDMSVMTRLVYSDVQILTINNTSICTSSCELTSFDLNKETTTEACVTFSCDFSLESSRDCLLNCLVGYFDTFFDLPHPVGFSTSPQETPTHWKQSIFLLKKPIQITQGQKICGKLSCERMDNDSRSLNIAITLGDSPVQVFQLQ